MAHLRNMQWLVQRTAANEVGASVQQGSPRGAEGAGGDARAQAAGVVGASAHGRVVGASAQRRVVGVRARGSRAKRAREEQEVIDLVSPPRVRPTKQRTVEGRSPRRQRVTVGPHRRLAQSPSSPVAPLAPASGHGRTSTSAT